MNIQERIEALETEFNEKIKALKEEEQEFPGHCDDYWFLSGGGTIDESFYTDSHLDNKRLGMGNMFETRQQAQFALEKLKVEAELRKFSKPFGYGENCTEFYYDHEFRGIMFLTLTASQTQGAIYFESKEKAQQAIETVGEERIKKYIFGVE